MGGLKTEDVGPKSGVDGGMRKPTNHAKITGLAMDSRKG